MLGSPEQEWWQDHDELRFLLEWLLGNNRMRFDKKEVLYFLSKPYKWNDEYKEMQAEKQKDWTGDPR